MSLRISLANWTAHKDYLCNIRRRVFIDEQRVPAEFEWDDRDESAIHLVALEGQEAVGCVRLVIDGNTGYVGHLAVLLPYRKQGIGSALLNAIEDYARNVAHLVNLYTNVQAHAYIFYSQQGYEPINKQFNHEAGIVHIGMKKNLEGTSERSMALIPGYDEEHYIFDNLIAANGLLHIAAKSKLHALNIIITDLRQTKSIWNDTSLYSALTFFLRYSPKRSIRILLGTEYSGLADHPFIQWQQRLSSRVQLHVHSEITRNLIVLQPYGLIDIRHGKVLVCLNDRVRATKAMNKFDDLWACSAPCMEARRLRL